MQEVTMIEIDPARALAAFRKALSEIGEFKEEAMEIARKADALATKRNECEREQYSGFHYYLSWREPCDREYEFKNAVSRLEQAAKRAEIALSAYRVREEVADWVIASEDGRYAEGLRGRMAYDQAFIDREGPVVEKMLEKPVEPPAAEGAQIIYPAEPPVKKAWWKWVI